jgi:hypothetical protein
MPMASSWKLKTMLRRKKSLGRGILIPHLYKQLRLMGDIDTIIADSADLIATHDLDLETVRDVLAQDTAGAG